MLNAIISLIHWSQSMELLTNGPKILGLAMKYMKDKYVPKLPCFLHRTMPQHRAWSLPTIGDQLQSNKLQSTAQKPALRKYYMTLMSNFLSVSVVQGLKFTYVDIHKINVWINTPLKYAVSFALKILDMKFELINMIACFNFQRLIFDVSLCIFILCLLVCPYFYMIFWFYTK